MFVHPVFDGLEEKFLLDRQIVFGIMTLKQ